MADLNEISVAIGRLQAEAESSTRQRAEIFRKLDEIKDAVSPLASLPAHVKEHCAEIDTLKSHVDRVKGAAWAIKAIWVATPLIAAGLIWLGSIFLDGHDVRLKRLEFQQPRSLVGPQ